jgi:tetratricopeptide (TPR) repeat protein
MNKATIKLTLAMLAALAVAGWAVPAGAQVDPLEPDAVMDEDPLEPGITVEEATAGDEDEAFAPVETDDVASVFSEMDDRELGKLIQEAINRRLKVERQQVAAEIRKGIMYDPDEMLAAIKILEDNPADTQKDNIDRIWRAYATVDPSFAKPLELFKAGKHAEAAEAVQKIVSVQEATYLSAAKFYLLAESLRASKQGHDAVTAYSEIFVNMPDRISFAASASFRAGQTYEEMGRFIYAMKYYGECVTNYGLTLDVEDVTALAEKIDHYQKLYKDPLGSLAGMMDKVEQRLAAVDSGKGTQQEQEQIVMILEDLIKTMEEQQKPPPPSSSSSQDKDKQKNKGQGEGQGQGQAQGQAQGKGSKPMGNNPSGPAMVSALTPGEVAPLREKAGEYEVNEEGDWATMPPRQRDELMSVARRRMSERHRNAIADFHKKMAEGGE